MKMHRFSPVQSSRRSFAVLVLLAVSAFVFAPAAGAAEREGRYIVVFKDSVEQPGSLARAQAEQRGGELGFVYRHALKGYSAALSEQAAKELAGDPRVAYVEEDARGGAAVQTTPTGISRTFASANKTLLINEKDDLPVNVDVAVIDSGIDYKHPDLNVVARTDCSNGASKSGECINESGTDGFGHGTHVAGTIAAIDNGFGVTGVAPGARLWGVKVLDSEGEGLVSEYIAGIDWVTGHATEIEVANSSLRYFTTTSSAAFSEAMKASIAAGVVNVAAAGNENEPVKYVPGNYSELITVSAIADYDGKAGGKSSPTCENLGIDDRKATFSNYGSTVDFAAPGVCIYSTFPTTGSVLGTNYGTISGTSMATPHVAGAAAIIASMGNPGSKEDVELVRELLVENGNSGWTDTSGDGITEPLLDLSNEGTFGLPRWSLQTTPNGSGEEHSILNDLACEPASTSVCTSVGKKTSAGGTSTPYAQYWNGKIWANQSAAIPGGATASELQADHCLSKTSCVAAGSYTTASGTFSLVEAWNGTSWSTQTTPNPAGSTETRLNGISCQVITACVAVGYKASGSSSQPVAIGGNSGTWTLQTVPLPTGAVGAELTGVECTSATSCRAVGRYYPTASATTYWAMVATWNGTTWSSEAVPKPTGSPKRSTLLDISCASSSDCTAVGGYMNSSGIQVSYVERWNGTSWSWQASPNPIGSLNTPLQNVSCVASSPCVAVGDWLEEGLWKPLAMYWNGTSWVIDGAPSYGSQTFGVLNGVSCRVTCLASGWYTDFGGKNKTLGETGI